MKTLREEIVELENEIRRHNRMYYDKDAPEISDVEYDELKEKLRGLYPESPVLEEYGNPTFGQKFEHKRMMPSLAKCHSAKEIIEKFGGKRIVLMPKIDGVSLALHFEHSRLQTAVTRGNCKVGEVVTHNAYEIENLPLSFYHEEHGQIEVRGEAYIAKKDFYGKMDQPGYDGFESGLANPRNAASGGLRQKDPGLTRKRRLKYVAYELFGLPEEHGGVHSNKLVFLKEIGFETPPCIAIECTDEETIQDAIDSIHSWDESLPYETDGVVVRIEKQSDFDEQGFSGKCPKGALAYKFETEKATSFVRAIEWSTNRTGSVTPVAVIDPTEICGSTVSRITLNNWKWLKDRDIVIGDKILFEKANEIIPKLIQVIEHDETVQVDKPTACPSCQNELVEEGVHLVCKNTSCPAQFEERVLHILKKLDIKGVAKATIKKVAKHKLISEPWEILDLSSSRLTGIGFGEKQSQNIKSAVSSLKATPEQILACLGIEGWGERMFELLFKSGAYTYEDLFETPESLSVEKLCSVSGIEEKMANNLIYGLGSKKQMLHNLIERIGVIVKQQPSGQSLSGKSFCVTGTLSKPRDEIKQIIKDNGGEVKSSVSSKLDYLVAGESAGSKLDKAKDLSVEIITEQKLFEMIGE